MDCEYAFFNLDSLKKGAYYLKMSAAGNDFQAQEGRKQSFSAILELNITEDAAIGVKKVQALAKKFSGYSVYSNLRRVTVKIPLENAELFMQEAEAIGVVKFREISSVDVTDEYTDLELRCKNLRDLRDRFAELLKKAGAIEDILKIESELARISAELERYQGKLNVLKNSVAMVTVDISFNTVAQAAENTIPVAWIRNLGVTLFNEKINTGSNSIDDEFDVEYTLEQGFVVIGCQEKRLLAVNGSNAILRMRIFDDLPGATIGFYQKLIEQQLKQNGFDNTEFKMQSDALTLTAVRGEYHYSVAIKLYRSGWLTERSNVLLIELLNKKAKAQECSIEDLLSRMEF